MGGPLRNDGTLAEIARAVPFSGGAMGFVPTPGDGPPMKRFALQAINNSTACDESDRLNRSRVPDELMLPLEEVEVNHEHLEHSK